MKALHVKFGKCDKLIKMQADFMESRGYDEKAMEIYDDQIEENLLDYNLMKKQISLLRT